MQSLKELTHTIEKGSQNNCYIRKHKGKGLLDETQWTHTTESQAAEVNEFSTTKLAGMPLLSDWQTSLVWASSLFLGLPSFFSRPSTPPFAPVGTMLLH